MTWPSRPMGAAEDDDPTGVRALLAALPDPGPMPEDVAARVLARLADAHSGHSAAGDAHGGGAAAGDAHSGGPTAIGGTTEARSASQGRDSFSADVADDDTVDGHGLGSPDEEWELATVLPFETVVQPRTTRGSRRPPRWLMVGGAVATVGAVLIGATAVYRGLTSDSSLSASVQQRDAASGSAAPLNAGGGQLINGQAVHVQMSGRAYSEAALTRQAQEILENPSAEVVLPVADANKIGPIATPDGLTSCITTLGEDDADQVGVDMATYAGQAAAVIVVVTAGNKQVFAVAPSCTQGDPQILVGPLPMT